MAIVTGKAIAQSFELVTKVSNEIQGLISTLNPLLEAALDASEQCILNGDYIEDWRNNQSSEAVTTDYAYSYPIKSRGKGKSKTERHIGFQISLTGDGISFPNNDEPLLHVFCWTDPVVFEETYIGFPIEDSEEFPLSIANDRLLVWNQNETNQWNEVEWSFSLKLLALNTEGDLDKQVITPILALLDGKSVPDALPDSLSGLVKYPAKELLTA